MRHPVGLATPDRAAARGQPSTQPPADVGGGGGGPPGGWAPAPPHPAILEVCRPGEGTASRAPSRYSAVVRNDVNANKVILAVVNAIEAKFSRADWIELGMLTDSRDAIENHGRLLRSLHWGDDDYRACILDVAPEVLGEKRISWEKNRSKFENLEVVEEYVGLASWLREGDQALYAELYGGDDTHEAATDDLQEAARNLGLSDVDEHAARIRRGLRDDPPLAIGASKELMETVFKAILGLEGAGKDTRLDVPELAKKVNVALGLDDRGARGDEPGAKQRRGILKGLNSIVNGIAEIRNEGFGTGHGVYGRPELDVATARLVVTAAAAAATFYIELHAANDE